MTTALAHLSLADLGYLLNYYSKQMSKVKDPEGTGKNMPHTPESDKAWEEIGYKRTQVKWELDKRIREIESQLYKKQ